MSAASDHDDPFAEMRRSVTPVGTPETAAAQRERVLARLRALQGSGAVRRRAGFRFRKRAAIVAALVAISSAAAAAWLHSDGLPEKSEPATEPVSPSVPATHMVTPASAAEVAPAPLPAPSIERPARAARPPRVARSAPKEESTLAQENGLLRQALASSRGGDDELAVSLHDSLIARYPRSPLAQNAELERLRALSRLGDVDSTRSAARRYLARYPDGAGADEARRLLLEPARRASNLGIRR